MLIELQPVLKHLPTARRAFQFAGRRRASLFDCCNLVAQIRLYDDFLLAQLTLQGHPLCALCLRPLFGNTEGDFRRLLRCLGLCQARVCMRLDIRSGSHPLCCRDDGSMKRVRYRGEPVCVDIPKCRGYRRFRRCQTHTQRAFDFRGGQPGLLEGNACRAKILLGRGHIPPDNIAVASGFRKLCFSAANGLHGACVQGEYALDESTELSRRSSLRCERPRLPKRVSGVLDPPVGAIDISADLIERALPFAVLSCILGDGAASLNESVFDLREPQCRLGKVDVELPSDQHVRVRFQQLARRCPVSFVVFSSEIRAALS